MFEANPSIRRLRNEGVVDRPLTYNGVIHRTGALLLITGVAFAFTWNGLQTGEIQPGIGFISSIVGLALALVIIFARLTNPLVIGAYAVAEGIALGTISYYAEHRYPGVALQAVAGTFGCFLVVLCLYSMKVLRATPTFVKVITAAILGFAVLYLADLVAGLFGHPLGLLHGSSTLSIGITAAAVLVASLSFVIDFAAIDAAVEAGVDQRQGWRFAFTLLVGLIWLYIEMLRLLTKVRGRN